MLHPHCIQNLNAMHYSGTWVKWPDYPSMRQLSMREIYSLLAQTKLEDLEDLADIPYEHFMTLKGDFDQKVLSDKNIQHIFNAISRLDFVKSEIENERDCQKTGEAIAQCKSLTSLKLGFNNLGQTREDMQKFFFSEQESFDPLKQLLYSLQQCTKLEELDLSANNIQANQCEKISVYLNNATQMKNLNLGTNRIGAQGAEFLSDAFKNCKHLVTLNLERNQITPTIVSILVDGLSCCKSLQHLNLAYNFLADTGMKTLADNLKNWEQIKILNLERNGILEDGFNAFAKNIEQCQFLQVLNLGQNYITLSNASCLNTIISCCSSLEDLNISDIELNTELSKEELRENYEKMTKTLKQNQNLKHLRFNFVSMKKIHGAYVAKIAEQNWKTFEVGQTDFEENHNLYLILSKLQQCENLQNLNITGHRMTDTEIKKLEEIFKNCPSLKILNASKLHLSSAEMYKELISKLEKASELEELHLSGLPMFFVEDPKKMQGELVPGKKHSVFLRIVEELKTVIQLGCLQALKHLNLSKNNILNQSIPGLAEIVKRLPKLELLNLTKNKIGPMKKDQMKEYFLELAKVKYLYLDSNGISDDNLETMITKLFYNEKNGSKKFALAELYVGQINLTREAAKLIYRISTKFFFHDTLAEPQFYLPTTYALFSNDTRYLKYEPIKKWKECK